MWQNLCWFPKGELDDSRMLSPSWRTRVPGRGTVRIGEERWDRCLCYLLWILCFMGAVGLGWGIPDPRVQCTHVCLRVKEPQRGCLLIYLVQELNFTTVWYNWACPRRPCPFPAVGPGSSLGMSAGRWQVGRAAIGLEWWGAGGGHGRRCQTQKLASQQKSEKALVLFS